MIQPNGPGIWRRLILLTTNRGVVGLEVTLETIQRNLFDFTRISREDTRCLLIRPFVQVDSGTGQTTTVHRVVVDTVYETTMQNWQDKLRMLPVEEAGDEVADYYHRILNGEADPSTGYRIGNKLLAHAYLDQQDMVLLVIRGQ